mmetsp:Transcript_60034/g.178721  ORF Transcript_60034/g.178721 Transcript_60034/m.178721 type:complete len:502 (-) Transcript_60034:34-1539(-)
MLCLPLRKPVLPAPGMALDPGFHSQRCEPVGGLPTTDVPEIGAPRGQTLVQGRPLHTAGGLHRLRRVVWLVDLAQALHNPVRAVLWVGLVGVQAVYVHARDVHIRASVDDPVREQPADAPSRQDAHGVQAGGHKVVPELRGLPDDGRQVWREALWPAEELAHPDLEGPRHPAHGLLEVGAHSIPVGLDLPEGEVVGNAAHVPGRGDRLEQAHQQPTSLWADVGVRGRVFYDRPVWVHIRHFLRDEVVVLRRLVRHRHTGQRSELPSPHSRAVHHVLRTDSPLRGRHACHAASLPRDTGGGHPLADLDATHASALGEGHGSVHGVDPPIVRHVEAGQDILRVAEGEQLLDLARANLRDVHAELAVCRCDPPELLQAVGVGGHRYESARLEAGGLTRLGLQAGVELLRVLAELCGRLRQGTIRTDQSSCVPSRPRSQTVTLKEDDVTPAHVRQVVGDRGADDPTADDHHTGLRRQRSRSGGRLLRHRRCVKTPARPRHGGGTS